MPRLSDENAEICEGPIALEEIKQTLMDCGAGKAPGIDGLPYELYKSIPELFRNILVAVYVNWQQNGFIPKSARRGVVTLIRKDPNKRDSLNNFGPITLLNTEVHLDQSKSFDRVGNNYLVTVLAHWTAPVFSRG